MGGFGGVDFWAGGRFGGDRGGARLPEGPWLLPPAEYLTSPLRGEPPRAACSVKVRLARTDLARSAVWLSLAGWEGKMGCS